MKLTTKYLLALIATVLLLNLSVAEARRTSGMAALANKGEKGDTGPQGPAGATGQTGPAGAAASCTPYYIGETGPDSGIVAYVDGSGCHGLEAQPYDVGASSGNPSAGVTMYWVNAVTGSAAYNTNATNIVAGYSCTTASNVLLRPYCWHLPSKTELNYLYEQQSVVGGFANLTYWNSTEGSSGNAWSQDFASGAQGINPKSTTPLRVRAVRAF
jgi:hypothetical protein